MSIVKLDAENNDLMYVCAWCNFQIINGEKSNTKITAPNNETTSHTICLQCMEEQFTDSGKITID